MEFVPARDQAHLIAAAIRVLLHRHNRPPTPEEISDILSLSREIVLHIVRGMEARGILRSIETPFEIRIDIDDHLGIEKLPLESKGPDMGREIEDFHRRSEDRQKRIERMMRENDPEAETRRKVSEIEAEFRRFKKKKGGDSPFREDGA